MRDAVGAPVPEVLMKCASLTQLTRENAIECILRHFGLDKRGACAFRHRPIGRNDP
jgi:hypothetical protein